MKVLMVAPYLYPEAGGVESYVYNISKRMVERGFDVTILCSTRDRIDEKKDLDGIKVIRQRPNFILSNTPIRLDLFFTMSKLVKENDFNIINAHTPVPFYADVAAMVSKIQKIPF
ncbi:glycosyltransferase, partial [bacterium]|nr:glycosyltransferase [bacterium]